MIIKQRNGRMPSPRLPIVISLISVLGLSGHLLAKDDQIERPEIAAALPQTISTALEQDPEVQLFATALKISNLWRSVETAKNITLFVPKDEVLRLDGSAFLLEVVLLKHENSERLTQLMAQHVFPSQGITLDAHYLSSSNHLSNSFGGCVSIEAAKQGEIRIGHEALVTGSRDFANGRIFYIDQLLWQQSRGIKTCL